MEFSIHGVLQCLQLSEKRQVLEIVQNASNLLLILYAISYIFNKKVDFLLAFLFVETLALSSAVSALSNAGYYLFFSFCYSILYWFVLKRYQMVKTSFGYAILSIILLVTAIDDLLFPEYETAFYSNYTSLIVFVHIYIIATTINWRLLGKRMGASLNALGGWLGVNYNMSFFWYTFVMAK
jgi:hypothetical protein